MIILKDGVRYNPWKPKHEVKEFEPMVKHHVKDIFGENCLWFNKTKIPTIPKVNRIPDGFVVDFTNKRWYIVELKILCDDAIRRIGDQITDDEEIPDNINALRKIALSIKKEIVDNTYKGSVSDIILTKKPEIIVVIDELNEILGEQFKKRAKKADKIIVFKTFVRDYVTPTKVHIHLFEPLYVTAREEPTKVTIKKTSTTQLPITQEGKVTRAKKGEVFPHKGYYIPILESLIELGGGGKSKVVVDKVEIKLKDLLRGKDLEKLSNGRTIRWRNRAEWARNSMVNEHEYMKKDSPRGIWEISDTGRKYYNQEKANWKKTYGIV